MAAVPGRAGRVCLLARRFDVSELLGTPGCKHNVRTRTCKELGSRRTNARRCTRH